MILKLDCDNKIGESKTVFIFIYEKSKSFPAFAHDLIVVYKLTFQTGLFIKPLVKLGKELVVNLNL